MVSGTEIRFVSMHIFIFSDVAFSEGNDAIILPKYFINMGKEAKKGGGVEKKISGLLQLQIQLKKVIRSNRHLRE